MLAALLVLLSLAVQEPEIHREFHEDGSPRCEAEVLRRADGALVRHGGFQSWHPGGTRESKGRYRDGERHGRWVFWHPDGSLRARGFFEGGLRTKEWEARLPDGSRDPAESGIFTLGELRYEELEERPRSARGELLDGEPHGAWTLYWPDGAKLARGELRAGRLHGPWTFRHADGSPDPTWISGVYQDGERVADLAAGALEGAQEPHAARAALRLDPRLSDEQREQARRDVALVLDEEDVEARRAAARRLVALGLPGIPFAVAVLRELSPADAAGIERGARLEAQVLAPLAGGASFGWAEAARAGRAADAQRALLRWHALGELGARDPELAFIELRLARAEGSAATLPVPRLMPAAAGVPTELGREARAALALRFGTGEPLSREALDAALAWLVAHQELDGRWDADGFMGDCGASACPGPGGGHNDVGVSALALLALMGEGGTTRHGRYQAAIAKGIGWLISLQDPETGRIETFLDERTVLRGPAAMYGHAIGTLVLCEAACASDSPRLRAAAERAVGFVLRARNPYSAWRYEAPPNSENDTSVTGWMVQALDAARLAGIEVPQDTWTGALSWIDEVTDPATGRVGYDRPGSLSARVESVNDHYPPQKGEPMTASGLWCRFLLGQRPETAPMMSKHADLMLQKLPYWDPDGFGCDMYYWFLGSSAMHQMGGSRHWEPWRRALRKAVVESQRQDGHTLGSWDPVGPWGFAGGRVYSTALMALCLETPMRRARLRSAAEASSKR